MIIDILTIFPHLLDSPLNEGIIKRARANEKIKIGITNIRDYATDKQQMTDDRPFGGGEGMVMKPEPLAAAITAVKTDAAKVIMLTPQGRVFNHQLAHELAEDKHLIFVCGRYEGVDERIISTYIDDEISIGDYVLTGGELAAMVVIDAVVRLLPGVLGCAESAARDTFSRGLLKHPQYTRPREFAGMQVPEVLLQGNHAAIDEFRFVLAVKKTLARRPDLLQQVVFSEKEQKILRKHQLDII
jgi:tRNA (guanine37-N1)-methyltransferase